MRLLPNFALRRANGQVAVAVLLAVGIDLPRPAAALAASPIPEPSSTPVTTSGAAATSVPPAGYSRADKYGDTVPVVTTRLLLLDDRRFPKGLPATVKEAQENPFVPANAFEELDDIYGLMALAVVHADWQEKAGQVRGHNIGGIIVNDRFEVVNWERNSNAAMCNPTQHGEVRTMIKHLNRTGARDLTNHQIYTSLEPCMMCSGMMMQSNVLRTVYMQTDNGFGKNVERLTIDTRDAPVRFDGDETGQNGYVPAARPVISSMSSSEFRVELDVAWRNESATKQLVLTEWLRGETAQDIYRRARAKFEHYPLRFGDQRARAKFIVPMDVDGNRMAGLEKFRLREATRTNAQLYADALAMFADPARGIIPYFDPDPTDADDTLVEDTKNVSATRLLEDPQALARAEQPGNDPGPSPQVPATTTLVVDGTVDERHVHQERIRRDCPKPSPSPIPTP